jgi:hypothetical protein
VPSPHLVTHLPPRQADAAWYGLRAWVERGFGHARAGGFNWQDTRMTGPARAARQWLAMAVAVASVLLLRQGGRHEQEQEQEQEQQQPTPAPTPAPTPRPRRILSVFCAGTLLVRIAALTGVRAPHAGFVPEPWPTTCPNSPAPVAATGTTPPP